MAKKKEKRTKKYHVQKHMHFIQIDTFMRPMEDFIAQIEKDEVYVDEQGCALMDLPNERILDMAAKGKNPRRAVDNIAYVLEAYFQITAYSCSDNDLERVHDEINNFNRKILKPLKFNTPIQRSSIDEAKKLCVNYRCLLKTAPIQKIDRVSFEMNKIINLTKTRGDKVVDHDELRYWILKEFGIDKEKNKKYQADFGLK